MNYKTKPLSRVSFLFLALFSSACSPTWQEYIDQASSLQSEKQTLEAIAIYEQALKKHPTHADAPQIYLQIGSLYYVTLQEPQRALQAYQKLIEYFPNHALVQEAFIRRAVIFEEQKAWAEAISAYEDILQRFPNHPVNNQYNFKIALFHWKRGDFKQAELELTQIIQSDPKGPLQDDIYFYLGEIYFSQGQFKKALDHYHKVVDDFPKSTHHIQAIYNAGLCLEHFGEWDEALTLYQRIKKTFPNQKMIRQQIDKVRKRRKEAGRG